VSKCLFKYKRQKHNMTNKLRQWFVYSALLSILSLSIGQVSYAQTPPTLDSEEWAFLTLINNYRAQNGAGPLQVSVTLENSSLWMSNDIATHNSVSHTDSQGRDPRTRMNAFGYPYYPWGENIAGGYASAQSVFTAWVNSPEHQQNMVNPAFVVMGIGRAYNSSSTYGWYWTTDFGGVVDQVINPPTASAPTIASFTATPATIVAGQSTTLSWTVSGASTVSIDNGIGDVSSVTSKSVLPTSTTMYTLTATNSAGTAVAHATVTVTPPTAAPTITSFTATPATIAPGQFSTLAWSVSGATNITVDHGVGDVSSVTSTAVSPAVSTLYTLYASNGAGTVFARVTVWIGSPGPVPTITSFTAMPSSIASGQSSTLSWNVSGATSITVDQGIGDVSNITSKSVLPTTTTMYTLTATNSAGTAVAHVTVTVTPPVTGAPTIAFFTATPSSIAPGQSSTLAWSVSGATTITLDHGIGDVSGLTSKVVSPAVSTLYTLAATNSAGTTFARITVWILDNSTPPTITYFGASQYTIKPGELSNLSWITSGATTLSLDQGIGDVSSVTARSVSPIDGTLYTLTATNNAGSAVAHVSVAMATDCRMDLILQNITLLSFPPSIACATVHNYFVSDITYRASDGNCYETVINTSVNGSTKVPCGANTPTLPNGQIPNPFDTNFNWLAANAQCWYTQGDTGGAPYGVSSQKICGLNSVGGIPNDVITILTPVTPGGMGSVPTITSFTATPATITAAQGTTLSWSISGATSVSIDNGVGDVSSVTSRSVSPSTTTTYTLTATNTTGSSTARVTVTVGTGPVGGQIILPANVTVLPGESALFQVTLAAPAPANGVFITLTSSDTSKVTVAPTNIFISGGATTAASAPKVNGISIGSGIITASASGLPAASQQVQVGTSTGPSAPTINWFTATPSAIAPGQGATLSWSVSGATAVSIDNGVGDVSGVTSKSVSPTQTTTYTLTATNNNGSVIARTTVTIGTAPVSGQIILPANVTVATGQSALFQVMLATPAPANGVFITLTSSDPSKVTVGPANIFIPEGKTTAASAPKVNGISIGSGIITASASGLTAASQPVQVSP
jgi:uncharacterized protein YkwD